MSMIYQSANCKHRKSLVALLTDSFIGCKQSVQCAGISTMLTQWLSSNVRIDNVIRTLKLLKINNEPLSSKGVRSAFCLLISVSITAPTYSFIDSSLDQWASVYVIFQKLKRKKTVFCLPFICDLRR